MIETTTWTTIVEQNGHWRRSGDVVLKGNKGLRWSFCFFLTGWRMTYAHILPSLQVNDHSIIDDPGRWIEYWIVSLIFTKKTQPQQILKHSNLPNSSQIDFHSNSGTCFFQQLPIFSPMKSDEFHRHHITGTVPRHKGSTGSGCSGGQTPQVGSWRSIVWPDNVQLWLAVVVVVAGGAATTAAGVLGW